MNVFLKSVNAILLYASPPLDWLILHDRYESIIEPVRFIF